MKRDPKWPEEKSFAFTIVDDTDNSTVENVGPIYDFLHSLGLRTTRTTWCYHPRDEYTGQSLQEEDYVEFIKDLKNKGFDIALHNVGSGDFTREEILEGLEVFKDKVGGYPEMHINHGRNPDNIYWGYKRFVPPFSTIYRLLSQKGTYHGEEPNSKNFWGNAHKKHIKYTRNLVFNGINTLAYDPQMPHREPFKDKYSNMWFSSSDGHTIEEFNSLIHPENINKLEREGGGCIVYTHFASGFLDTDGNIDPTFKERMKYLSERNGWFVPAGTILDHLLSQKEDKKPPYSYFFWLNLKWGLDRIRKKSRFGR